MLHTTRHRRNLLLRGSILAALGLYGCTTSISVEDGENGSGGSGASSGQGGSTGGAGGHSTGSGGGLCAGAMPIIEADGTESGYAQCPDGTVHRYDPQIACSPEVHANACQHDEMTLNCTTHDECNEKPNGRCTHLEYSDFGGDATMCGCVYPCTTDADCDPGNVCLCDGVMETGASWSVCAPAQCVGNSACASGECGVSSYFDGCGYAVGLACRSSADACRVDQECGTDFSWCALQYGTARSWTCNSTDCAIGRPLLVAGQARTAKLEGRADWSTALDISMAALAPELRTALARHWEKVAALEHASVASFARFSLQLLALGAPPELLADAQRAALDEIEHAKIGYALASAYAGRDVGPGPLALGDVDFAADRRTAALELVAEACVGETLGAAEARELAACVTDPSLRRLLERIADDERRHAELGWRALAWMLEGADETLRAEVRGAFAAAVAAFERTNPADPEVVAAEHGLPSGAELAAIRRQALRDVVSPCARQLLG